MSQFIPKPNKNTQSSTNLDSNSRKYTYPTILLQKGMYPIQHIYIFTGGCQATTTMMTTVVAALDLHQSSSFSPFHVVDQSHNHDNHLLYFQDMFDPKDSYYRGIASSLENHLPQISSSLFVNHTHFFSLDYRPNKQDSKVRFLRQVA